MDEASIEAGRGEPEPPRPVVLLLPGQGSQHRHMAVGLYRHEPVFTAAMDEVFDALGPAGELVRHDWLAAEPVVPIDHLTRSQVLLFAVDHALGRLVLSWGVRPVALLGHSVGELAAATLAGVFSVPDATALLWDRVTRLAAAPPGGMLAVAAAAADLAPYLRGDVVVGAVNSPRQTIIAGPREPLQQAAAALRRDGFVCAAVAASTAFHSPALAELAAGAAPLFAATAMRPPALTVYSGYTGSVLGAAEALSPSFWARQPAAPVWFWSALDAVLGTGAVLLCEAGPGQGLTMLARRHPEVTGDRSAVVGLLPARPRQPAEDRQAVAAAAARIAAAGHDLRLAGTQAMATAG